MPQLPVGQISALFQVEALAVVGVVSDIERQLARLRERETDDGTPDLRTSTMTHIVWCPPAWRRRRAATLAGLYERHPARTIFLIPEPGRRAEVVAKAELRDFRVHGLSREVLSEVIEIRLRGSAARQPGSILLPLLVSGLPVFCRWRASRLGTAANSSRSSPSPIASSSTPPNGAACRLPIRRLAGPVRSGGRLRHRVLAFGPLAAPARRTLARDRGCEEAAGRRPSRGCGARRRLAAVAAEARRGSHAPLSACGHGDVGRRRPGLLSRGAARARASCCRPSSTSSAATASTRPRCGQS